jgi:MoaA/NifB/PqqE/SkfB family radical SAM enzyme
MVYTKVSVINNIFDIKRITFELTSHCNLHCPQCARFDQQGFQNKYLKLEHLNFKQIEKNLCVDQLTQLPEILFEGDYGEPLMHPEIEYILNYFSNNNKTVVTNGSLRSISWWKQLAKIPNLSVMFSIDGIDQTTNSTYRINSNFDKIIDNATAFIAAGGTAVWKYIVFKHNELYVDQARALSKKLGFSSFEYQKSNRNFFNDKTWPIYVDGNYRGMLEASTGINTKLKTQTIGLSNLKKNFTPPVCSWGATGKVYIDYQANLVPCCMTSGLNWRNDLSGKLWQRLIGDPSSVNLYHNNLNDVLQSDFYSKTLQESFSDKDKVHHACLGNCSK